MLVFIVMMLALVANVIYYRSTDIRKNKVDKFTFFLPATIWEYFKCK